MYESDRDGSLTHCRCNALEATSANIANREYSGQTCFKQMGSASEWPIRGGEILGRQIPSGLDESIPIESNAPLQPMCVWYRASHDEQVAYSASLHRSGCVITPAHALQMITALERRDL